MIMKVSLILASLLISCISAIYIERNVLNNGNHHKKVLKAAVNVDIKRQLRPNFRMYRHSNSNSCDTSTNVKNNYVASDSCTTITKSHSITKTITVDHKYRRPVYVPKRYVRTNEIFVGDGN